MVLNDYGTRIFPGVKTAAHAFFGPRGLAVKVGRRGKPPGHRNAYVVRREYQSTRTNERTISHP